MRFACLRADVRERIDIEPKHIVPAVAVTPLTDMTLGPFLGVTLAHLRRG
jgi:hypothetical protein